MKKVLILEDEVNIRSFVVINLKRAGYDAIEAGTGQEALDRLAENPDIGVAILDIMLPDMDGFEVLSYIKHNDQHAQIPVIVMTQGDSEDDEVFIGRDYEKTKGYSEQVAGVIDEQVKLLIDKAYRQCQEILTRDGEKLKQVAHFLMEKETMTGEQFRACMEGRPIEEASAVSFFEGETESSPSEKADSL